MPWQSTMVIMVRNLIGDMADSPVYDNNRLREAIVTAGLISAQEYPFDTAYTFDLDTPTLSPDPTEPATLDLIAVALFTLKASCILTMNSYQKAIGTGIRVKDGDSEVDTTGSFKGYADILKNGPCASYTKLLSTVLNRRGMNRGRAVLSPYSSGNAPWGVRSYNGVWHIRSFYDNFLSWF